MKSNKKIIGVILLLIILLGVNSCFIKESFASASGQRAYCGIKNIKGQTQSSWANNIVQGEGMSINENGSTYYWSLSEFLKNGGNDGTVDTSRGWVEKQDYQKNEFTVSNGIISVDINGETVLSTLAGKIINQNSQQLDGEIDIDKISIYQRGYLGIQTRNVGDLQYKDSENWSSDLTKGSGKKVVENGITYFFSSRSFLRQDKLGTNRVRGWLIYSPESFEKNSKLDSEVDKTSDGYIINTNNEKYYYDINGNSINTQQNKENYNDLLNDDLKSVANIEGVTEKNIVISNDAYKLYLKDLYYNVLKKYPTQEELEELIKKSIFVSTTEIMLSNEAKQKNSMDTNKDFIIACYNYILKTDGEETGISSNEAWLNAGNTREDLIKLFINSDEFATINVIPYYEKNAKIDRENDELRKMANVKISKIDNPIEKQKAIEEVEKLERLSRINLIKDDMFNKYIKSILEKINSEGVVDDNLVESWLNIHKDGYDIDDILIRIFETEMFKNYINGLDDEEFIEKLYEIITYQNPNENTKQIALNYLKTCTREDWIKNHLLKSVEYSSLKYKLIKNTFNFKLKTQDEYNPNIKTDKKGDINGDGIVDARDASMLLTIVSDIAVSEEDKYIEYKDALDINSSGTVTTHDAVILLKFYAVCSTGYRDTLENYLQSDLYKKSEVFNENN